jgi:hypothetical protein
MSTLNKVGNIRVLRKRWFYIFTGALALAAVTLFSLLPTYLFTQQPQIPPIVLSVPEHNLSHSFLIDVKTAADEDTRAWVILFR